jgi:hypothetical protein
MTHYFFDLKTDSSVEHDYRGQYLPSLERAEKMAELIAMDLSCTRNDEVFPVEVQIRNAKGLLLLSVPVMPMEALAA